MPPSVLTHYDVSEKVCGLIWVGRRDAKAYDASNFAPPFDDIVKILQRKGATHEDVLKKISDKFVNSAKHSVAHLNGLGEEKVYDDLLIKTSRNALLSQKFGKLAQMLERNDDLNLLPVVGELNSLIAGQSTSLVPATQIDYHNYKPFMKCGYAPIDNVLGGIPTDGPIVVYGVQGTGKSHFGSCVSLGLLKQYKKKNVGIFTLEMGATHYMWRATKMYKELDKYLDRLYVSGAVRDANELVAEIQGKQLDFIVIDDMDRLTGSPSPEKYQATYMILSDVSRFMGIPIMVLAQPNREAKLAIQAGERFLTAYDVSWSSGAENSAAYLVGLQKARLLDMKTQGSKGERIEPMFPVEDQYRDYLIFWKSRDGWPGDYDPKGQFGPGAIILEQDSKEMWMGSVVGNRLWKPYSTRTAIGRNRK